MFSGHMYRLYGLWRTRPPPFHMLSSLLSQIVYENYAMACEMTFLSPAGTQKCNRRVTRERGKNS